MPEATSTNECVRKLLSGFNPGDVSDLDLIDVIAPLLGIVYRESLKFGKVLTLWRQPNVNRIFKKESRYEASN